jgi:hypothetical protein
MELTHTKKKEKKRYTVHGCPRAQKIPSKNKNRIHHTLVLMETVSILAKDKTKCKVHAGLFLSMHVTQLGTTTQSNGYVVEEYGRSFPFSNLTDCTGHLLMRHSIHETYI